MIALCDRERECFSGGLAPSAEDAAIGFLRGLTGRPRVGRHQMFASTRWRRCRRLPPEPTTLVGRVGRAFYGSFVCPSSTMTGAAPGGADRKSTRLNSSHL